MRRTLALLLPAVFPSWRFFKTVGPSPRIRYRLAGQADWREAFPTPRHLGAWQVVGSLFWNPARNARLYMVSCAEKLSEEEEAPRAEAAIRQAISAQLQQGVTAQFRVVYLEPDPSGLGESICFESAPWVVP